MARGTGNGVPTLRPRSPRHVRVATPEQRLSELWLLAMTCPDDALAEELMRMARTVAVQLDKETAELCLASAEERAETWLAEFANSRTRVVVGE